MARPKKNTMQIFSNFLKQQRNIILHLIKTNVLIRPIVFRLGYQTHDRTLRPDPERVKTLLDIPLPKPKKEMSRAIGLFAYYAKWLPRFSCKVKPLVESRTFPLNENAVRCFCQLKNELADATQASVDRNVPFTLETNASDVAVSAVL